MDLKHFLKTLPAFERFAPEHLDVLSELMEVSSHRAGQKFIVQGQQGDAMFLLMEGAVQTLHVDEVTGEQEEARELHAGEMFGLLSLVDNMPAGWTSVAKDPATVAALGPEEFRELFAKAPPIAHHLQYMIAVQLARNLQERNRELRELLQRRAAATAA